MIHTVRSEFVATCNGCGDEYYGGTQDNFLAFVQELKTEAGWEIVCTSEHGAVKKEYEHYCSDCRSEPPKPKIRPRNSG